MEPPTIGIRAGYPRIPAGEKLRGYLAASRPFTLLAPLVGILAALALAVGEGATSWSAIDSDWRTIAYGAATLMLVQIGSNLVNQATDTKEDSINKKYRPLIRGVLATDEATTLGHILWFVAILRATLIGATFGILVATLVAISYLYSTPPVRLKRMPWMGNLGIATARGLLGFLAAWSLVAPLDNAAPWAAGSILFLYLLGAATSKDFGDEAGDRACGVKTLVVKYGPAKAAALSIPFAISPVLTLPLANQMHLLHVPFWAYLVATLTTAVFCYRMAFHHDKENRILEGTRIWLFMYANLMVLMLALSANGLLRFL